MANERQQPQAESRASTPATGTATVTVASKLPAAFVMRVFEWEEHDELVMGGGMRRVKQARELPQQFTINGCAHYQTEAPACQIVGEDKANPARYGFALTPGVPKELWERWLSQNAKSDMVRNGIIFAHEGHRNAEAEAREKVDIKTGLERLDPKKLPRGVKPFDQKIAA